MKAPSCSSGITETWVQFILEEYFKQNRQDDPKVTVEDFTVGEGAEDAEGCGSELVSLDVTASLIGNHSKSEPETAEYHFMVKFLSSDAFSRVVDNRFKSSLKEYTIYNDYINDLNTLQASHTKDKYLINIPQLIYGKHTDSEGVLVMENLVFDGYAIHDKCKGLDGDHLREAVMQLARFHALSYAHSETHDFLAEYPYFEVNPDALKLYSTFFDTFIDNGIALLMLNEDTEEVAKKFDASREKFDSVLMDLVQPEPDVPNCVVHGDFLNSNIMYKYNNSEESGEGSGSISSCKIIDWGNTVWGSPVLDLQYLIKTSTTRDTRKEHLEATIRCYHETYTEVTTEVGTPVPNWTFEALQKEWKRLEPYGFILGLGLTLGTLSKSNPLMKPKSSSVLNNSFCFPGKAIVDGIQSGMAKMSVSFLMTQMGQKLLIPFYKKLFLPVKEELESGENEILNNRVLNLILEADDNGLFDEE